MKNNLKKLILKKILFSFSYIFHPILIPIMGCVYFFFANLNQTNFTKFEVLLTLFQVVVITIFIPISCYYLLKSLGKVDSVMVSKLSERKIPLIIQAVLIMVLLKKGTTEFRIPELYYFFLSGLLSTLLLLLFLYMKVKASIHLVGMASLLFFVIGLSIHTQQNYINTIVILLLITGFVASSRLVMKAHSLSELVFGFVCGMVSQIFFWRFWI